jgi:biopolymer transport protein ExbD
MNWSVRHEGSPNPKSGLTSAQVLEGLREGIWEPTDEIRGPQDNAWTPLEAHPTFAEVVADMEPKPPRHHDDESHLDMNPLIDVALVLLIFFILTTSYEQLRRVLDMPAMASAKGEKIRVLDTKTVNDEMIKVEARIEGGKCVYKIQDVEVPEANLQYTLETWVQQGRKQMIVDARDVTWESVIKILDAAKGARVNKWMMRVRPGESVK